MFLSGKRMQHLHEIDGSSCHDRLGIMISQMNRAKGIIEALKEMDQMRGFYGC